jgi:hypothetical protein
LAARDISDIGKKKKRGLVLAAIYLCLAPVHPSAVLLLRGSRLLLAVLLSTMVVLRAAWALLALCHVTHSLYLPTEHPGAALAAVDASPSGFRQLVSRQTTTCSSSNPCKVGCCGNGGDKNNA